MKPRRHRHLANACIISAAFVIPHRNSFQVNAFTPNAFADHKSTTELRSSWNECADVTTRRRWAAHTAVLALCLPTIACAKEVVSDDDENKRKLYKGYQGLNYLLDNWVDETTVCSTGNDNPYLGKCERNPIKVMEYLGYKNTKHPLFRADRTMARLESLVPEGRESAYTEAVEQWIQSADEGSGMAYISSWGEANPGGGKDRVQLFVERAKKNVMDAQQSLATIIDILEIDGSGT